MSPAFASGEEVLRKTSQYQGRRFSGTSNEPEISQLKSTTAMQQTATFDLAERWFPYSQIIRTEITNLSAEHHAEMIYAITSTRYHIKMSEK
jgi:N-formylglutamate amidohydrolase